MSDSAGRGEAVPHDVDEVTEAADEVEDLVRRHRGFDDAAGVNPERSQDTSGSPDDAAGQEDSGSARR